MQHVQQLLRSLNLNSPAPFSQGGYDQEFGSIGVSPDVSPVSTTSALMTPPELSPTKGFGDWKFNPAYDFNNPVYQTQSNNGLLFETESPHRYENVGPLQTPTYPSRSGTSQPVDPFQSSARSFGFTDPFADRGGSRSAHEGHTRPDTSPRTRQDPSLLHPSWSNQRLRSSSEDWIKSDERRGSLDHSSSASEIGLGSQGSRSSNHEVSPSPSYTLTFF